MMFKHRKVCIEETIKTEAVGTVFKLKGVSRLISQLYPWLRYQYLVNKGIKNLVAYTNPVG